MSHLSYRLALGLLAISACSTVDPNANSATDGEDTTGDGSTSGQPQTTGDPTTSSPTTSIGETDTTGGPSGTSGGTTGVATTDSSNTDASTTVATTETDTSTGGVMPTCEDGEKNGDETDTDCGGPTCNPCADGSACLADADCQIMSCVDNTCGPPPPSCSDGQLNADETDIDCGGPSCDACADNLMCALPDDCQSKNCKEGTCAPAACDDTVQNGSETDIDCGGFDCKACEEGQVCNADADCATNSCVDKLCVPATCEDTKLNNGETDVDCGGPNCPKCGDGLACMIPADCLSGVCDDQLVCAAASCMDSVKNGMETDVDCGGPDCKPCSIPGLVINEVDYDQVGTDNAEFIEILNNTAAPINLAGHRVLLVNGSNNAVYTNIDLAPAGTINPGQYLVIAPAAFVVPPGVLKVNFGKANDNIENGSPDGVALVNTLQLKLVDALSYEGAITMVMVPGLGNASLVEGMALPMNVQDSNVDVASLARLPDGYDGNNAATDWKLSKTPTAGLPNVP